MSLINEALKKAQRQRHEAATPGATAAGQTGSVTKRGQPRSAQTTLLIAAGAVLLVVLSIAATAFWLTRSPSQPAAVAAATSRPTADKTGQPAAPVVTFNSPTAEQAKARTEHTIDGATKPAAESTSAKSVASGSVAAAPKPAQPAARTTVVTGDARTTERAESTESPSPKPTSASRGPTVGSVATASSVAALESEPAGVAKAEPAPPPKPDERIQRFVDDLKVAGVRPSGADSKVLMNDRVYRLNDFVDRTLGLRLTKVTRESLTFTDASGVKYVKDL